MERAGPQSFFAAVEPAGKEIPPQAHAALAAAEEAWISISRISGSAREASHEPFVGGFERACHVAIPHAEQPERARCLLAEDVTRRCRRDALAREKHNPIRTFGRESGEGSTVRSGQALPRGNPARRLSTLGCTELAAFEMSRLDGINRLRKARSVDQHAPLLSLKLRWNGSVPKRRIYRGFSMAVRRIVKSVLLGVALFLVPVSSFAQRAKSPADAAVFIRIVGSVHTEVEEFGVKRSADLDHVEIGTGSGFVISPYGYVITNDHVVNESETILITRIKGFQEAKITMKTSRIDVCFQPETAAGHGLTAACTTAAIAASDRVLDLAVLFIGGSNLPYIAFGDSDAVASGLQVEALGFPLGHEVEVGRAVRVSDIVPNVSSTPGAVSALRVNDAGERRYLQITNSVNPGNSGGPLVDRDGFVVGVIRMRLERAPSIAFAIPINDVKDFLESHGLDHVMQPRRLRLGPMQNLEAKGIALRFPEALADGSPFQSHVETPADGLDIVLRIDRVLSPWEPRRLFEALIGGQTFESLLMTPRESRPSTRSGDPPMLLGGAASHSDTGRETRIDYAILDLGPEKLVARYVGSSEWMAFNESVLRESLSSLQAQRFVTNTPITPEKLEWSTSNPRGMVPVPAGWTVEPGRPSPCSSLPQPAFVTSAFPARDFTIMLRAAVWAADQIEPETAASTCSPRRGSTDGASYASRGPWLGIPYLLEGAFVRVGSGQVIQLEVLATEQRAALARALLGLWVKKASE
jgi:S1-C subfamily serine protease